MQYDITDLDIPDDSFDLIICYHILEHVEEDLKAMQELYRVMKKSGVCIIQTPFKEGKSLRIHPSGLRRRGKSISDRLIM